ncbi:MAG: diaminopimelate decarboxylase [Pseudomonadota bacterium]|nr:diaminopimelate decarboxylase [Pseudomonadota bacterium]
MDYFNYQHNRLHADAVDLTALARQHGTPLYVYSRATLERHWHAFNNAFGTQPHLVCYAVKANSSLAILNLLARLGSGFDIVSAGELERVLRAGGEAARVVFSGVGKKPDEMRCALQAGIRCFNVESQAELVVLNRVAGELGLMAPVSLRVNPDVDAQTHPYISTGLKENKFGISHEDAVHVYRQAAAMSNIRVTGIDCHIGSQLIQVTPFVDALKKVLALVDQLAADGINLHHIDLGGGLGIRYRNENPPTPAEQIHALLRELGNRQLEVLVEPGRAIVGNAGVLVTEVLYLKHNAHKNFAIIDAAMNDLMRPALYSAWMDIVPLQPREGETKNYDLVGPVCETGDFLGKDRALSLQPGDLLAVRSAGAYGFSMSSNYNTRPRAAEIMVDGSRAYLVRPRETLDQLLAGETILE